MKKEEEEEEEELLVSVDEEDACVTDTQHHDLRSEVIRPQLQGWGLHLVAKHPNCSSFSQRLQNIPDETFMRGLYICFTFSLMLALVGNGPSIWIRSYEFNPVFTMFVMFAAVIAIALVMSSMGIKSGGSASQKRDAIPAVSATVQQV